MNMLASELRLCFASEVPRFNSLFFFANECLDTVCICTSISSRVGNCGKPPAEAEQSLVDINDNDGKECRVG